MHSFYALCDIACTYLVCIDMVLFSLLFIIGILKIISAGPVYADGCYCPVKSVSDWLKSFDCKSSYDQINSDLRPFPNVNFAELRGIALQKFNHPGSMSICNYVVKDNQVMVKCWLFHYYIIVTDFAIVQEIFPWMVFLIFLWFLYLCWECAKYVSDFSQP